MTSAVQTQRPAEPQSAAVIETAGLRRWRRNWDPLYPPFSVIERQGEERGKRERKEEREKGIMSECVCVCVCE